jgi:uroporphyrinogen III methyltransferase/synthase
MTSLTSNTSRGIVYLVGAGPGDPGLITVRGADCLRQADVVIHDRLANAALLAYADRARLIIDVGKQPDHHPVPQDQINALLIEHARAGQIVVRLKGGDPFVFGRGGEEALALTEAGLPFEIVPGVTSAIAAAAYAGIPVTHRDLACSVTFITGHRADGCGETEINTIQRACGADTLVFLMGVHNLGRIVEELIACGKSPDLPVAVVSRGTQPDQVVVIGTLSNIADRAADIQPPAVIVVGEVVNLHKSLSWFDVTVQPLTSSCPTP